MQLELSPLELNMLAVLYGAYVTEQPDEDSYSQQQREALAVKLSRFDEMVQDAQPDCPVILAIIACDAHVEF